MLWRLACFVFAIMPGYSLKYSKRAARTAFIAFFLLIAGRAFADNSKISPDLQPLLANSSNQINVIVQYNTPPQQSSGGLLGGLLGGVVNLLGGVLNTVFSLIPAVSATLHPADVLAVSNQSNVAYISLDRPLGASLDYSAAAVGAPSAWSYGLEGDGIGVAVKTNDSRPRKFRQEKPRMTTAPKCPLKKTKGKPRLTGESRDHFRMQNRNMLIRRHREGPR